MSWAEAKIEELENKGRKNWTADDWEAYCYCQECFAEDAADQEYLDHYLFM